MPDAFNANLWDLQADEPTVDDFNRVYQRLIEESWTAEMPIKKSKKGGCNRPCSPPQNCCPLGPDPPMIEPSGYNADLYYDEISEYDEEVF